MWRSLLALKPRDVPMRVALRNTLAIVAPLAIGIATGRIEPALAIATGALNTMFTDQPGPYRLRMQRMLLAASTMLQPSFRFTPKACAAPSHRRPHCPR